MKKGLNHWSIIGNVGKEPELRHTQNGTPVCSFSVAINNTWKDADGNVKENVEWVSVVCWKKLAEIAAQWVKKGAPVFVEGRAHSSTYEHEGQKKYKTELIADNLILLGGKRDEDAGGSTQPGEAINTADEGDLPF